MDLIHRRMCITSPLQNEGSSTSEVARVVEGLRVGEVLAVPNG